MAVIPRSIYRVVEWHLHNVPRILGELEDGMTLTDRDAILSQQLPSGIPKVGGGRGSHSDRVASAGIALAHRASKNAKWQQWMRCIQQAQWHFDGPVELDMANRYYGTNTTVLAVAEDMFVDKQTVNRYRDKYVTYVALCAACDGLITLGTREACGG